MRGLGGHGADARLGRRRRVSLAGCDAIGRDSGGARLSVVEQGLGLGEVLGQDQRVVEVLRAFGRAFPLVGVA